MAGEGGANPSTVFTEIPSVIGRASVQSAPGIATALSGPAALTTNAPSSHTGWLFPSIGHCQSAG
jgi:hypothetical protein